MQNFIANRKILIRDKRPVEVPNEMSFMDHLEALRWHLVRSVAVILGVTIAMFVYIDWIFDHIVYGPARKEFISYTALCNLGHSLNLGESLCMPPVDIKLVGNTISGPFMSAISIAFTGGIIIAFPYLFWELWKFIKPGLSNKETKMITSSIGWVTLCFFLGAAFGYFLLAPFTFNFLANYKLGSMGAYIYLPTLDDYISTLTSIILGCAIGFELPVIVYVLARIGVVSASLLKQYRKYAFVIILVVAAVITPSPDWISQVIVTIPLIFLYEISILLAQKVERQRVNA
jgi:sec-independent protein translocase protein TatC